MSNYEVEIRLDHNDSFHSSLTLKVKHFRLSLGKELNPNGGFTTLFELHRGLVFHSKCRSNEQFSRKKGILTCLQKMIRSKSMNSNFSNYYGERDITSVEFCDNGAVVWIGKSEQADWWLSNGACL